MAGIELNGPVIILNRLPLPAKFAVGNSTVVINLCISRIDRGRLVKIENSLAEIAKSAIGGAPDNEDRIVIACGFSGNDRRAKCCCASTRPVYM